MDSALVIQKLLSCLQTPILCATKSLNPLCTVLASPVFIAASFLHDVYNGPDPIYRACVLHKELREVAEHEYELKNEYFRLSDASKEFSVDLLKECNTMEEITGASNEDIVQNHLT